MNELAPRLLTHQEHRILLKSNADHFIRTSLLADYTEDKLLPVRIGSVNVLLFAQEHTSTDTMETGLYPFLRSDLTKHFVLEYFNPELRNNARNFPLVGPLLEKRWEKTGLPLALWIQEYEARNERKPVSVIDIANKPEYMLNYWMQSWLPVVSTSQLFSHGVIEDPAIFVAALMASSANLLVYFGNRFDEFKSKKGFFDKEQIHPKEKWIYDTEDARRVFVAAGLKQLAEEYQPIDTYEDEIGQIVVPYPRAHALRIRNYLLDPTALDKASRKVKQILYRGYPGLDYSVRTYQWKDMLAGLSDKEDLAGWRQTSNRPITFFA